MEIETPQQFVALVLAADRTDHDPVTREAGTVCKAIATVAGRSMVLRVLDALESSDAVGAIVLCGPPEPALAACPELHRRIDGERVSWIMNLDSPCKSAEAGLAKLGGGAPVLVTTADHALLSTEIVTQFAQESLLGSADATVALVEHDYISRAFPETHRTVIRMRDGRYCGCNLFTLLTERGRSLVSFWRQVEQSRKHPWKMVAGILGARAVLSYLFGALTLERALAQISKQLEMKLEAVVLPFAEAGIDVDTPSDRLLVERILEKRSDRCVLRPE
ncbi:MAG: nucleotidyltransferase family protein [Gammaproteobacteria bacterium]